jgi:hypothetical protein
MNNMQDSTFARVIACEKDEIAEGEFSAKVETWFALLKLKSEPPQPRVEAGYRKSTLQQSISSTMSG